MNGINNLHTIYNMATVEVKTRLNIIDIIGEVIPLARRGQRYWGLCPFHQEKTPSFSVNPEKGTFHCFGCHASGDVISFVMMQHRLEFKDARDLLAARAGIPIHESTPESRQAVQEAFRKRQQQKNEINYARRLIREQYWRLCDLEQAAHQIIRTIKTETDLDRPEVIAALKVKEEIDFLLDQWHEADEPGRLSLALAVAGRSF